jgi:hypothetical protein
MLVVDWRDEYNTYRPHSAPANAHAGRVRRVVADQPASAHITGGPIGGVRSAIGALEPGERVVHPKRGVIHTRPEGDSLWDGS